jgi:hypothetical protein
LVLLIGCGPSAGCAYFGWGEQSDYPPAPVLFAEPPQLDALITAINRNDQITRMESTATSVELVDASLPVSRLDARLSVERPQRLRLQARIPMLLSSGLDVGSNEELFWMRYPDGMHQTLLYARHQEYEPLMPRGPLPVNPTWIIQALGLTHVDRQQVIAGPLPTGDGSLELRLQKPTAAGPYEHVLQVDAARGFIRSHSIHDPSGRLVARADTNEHGYYEDPGVILPHQVRIRLEPVSGPPIDLNITVQKYVLNQFLSESPDRFRLPADGNAQVIDLARIPGRVPPAQPSTPGGQPLPGAILPPGATSPPGTVPPPAADSRGRPTATAPPTLGEEAIALPPLTQRAAEGVAPGSSPPTRTTAPAGQSGSETAPVATPVNGYVPRAALGPELRGTRQR